MKRLLLIFALAVLPAIAAAQTVNWTVVPTPGVTQSATAPQGGAVSFSFDYKPSVAVTAGALDIEIHDPNGAKIAYPGLSWTNPANFTAGQTITETLTWPVPATAVLGKYTVVTGAYSSNGTATTAGTAFTNQYWNLTAGSFTVTAPTSSAPPSSAPPPVTTPPATSAVLTAQLPVCWPTTTTKPDGGIDASVKIAPLPADVEPATGGPYDSYAVAVCNYTTKFVTTAILFKKGFAIDALALEYAAGLLTVAQANANYLAQATPYTTAELSYVYHLRGYYRPTAAVQYGLGSIALAVYTLNADGTRNPTQVAGEAVLSGDPCDPTDKIPTDQNYFNVSGRPNALTGGTPAILPAGTYAMCVIRSSIGWNNP